MIGPRMIALIACSSQKLARLAPARELYTSQLFQKSLAYAERRCDRSYVVSALHGLVELEQLLKPYDRRLGGKREREAWAGRIAQRLLLEHGRDAFYVVLAGIDYAGPLRGALTKRGLARENVIEPLAGMQIGERLSFLKAQSNLEVPEPRVAARPRRFCSSASTPTPPAVAAKPAPSRRSSP